MTLKALGETARFINGAAFKPADWEDGGLPIIRIQNLTGTREKFNFTSRQVKPELVVEPGDLLVSWSATLDVYRWTGPRGVLNQHIFKVLPNPGIDPDYLFYALKSALAELSVKTHGSTMKHVVRGDFESTQIRMPPLAEQRRVVDILSRAEGIVRLRREAEKKAAELIPALFLDMFGDPATNPKGWPVAPVSTLCDKCSTTDPRKTPQAGFTYIDIAAIDNGRGSIVEPKPVLGADAPSRARQVVKAGDVIVSTVRPNLRGSAMVPDDLDGQICSTGFCVLRPRATATSAYVFALVRSDWFVDEIMKKVRGAQYPAVTDKDLFGHPIPLPPLSFQQQFSMRFADIIAIQSQQAAASATAQATFDALLAQVFHTTGTP